jgi:hypothetical protein
LEEKKEIKVDNSDEHEYLSLKSSTEISRFDMTFAVGSVSKFMSNYGKDHWKSAKNM